MSRLQALSTFLYRRPRLALALLLGPPLLWLGVVYLGSLGALLLQSFFQLDHYTGQVVREPTLATWRALASRANLDIVLRTAGMATAVTLAAAVLAFPLAFYMAFRASRRVKALLYLAVTLTTNANKLIFLLCCMLILSFYGAGFATVPAYLRDLFGTYQVGAIHGRLLTAWSVAGVLGPVIVNAIADARITAGITGPGRYTLSFTIMVGLLIIAFVTAILAYGTKLSAGVSLAITAIKVAVVLLVGA